MKLKILKRMVAAVCVATISTSCISPSVGAFKAPANARVDVVNSVNQLNGSLDSLNNMLDGMLEITRREEQKCSVNDYDRQIELVTVLSNLEESKRYANELNEVVVYDSELANNLRGKLYGLVTTQKLASREINPQLCHYLPKGYLDTSNAMRKGLENIKRMLKQNDDSGKPNGIEGLVAAMIKATKDEKEKYEEKKYDARAIELDMLLEDLQYVQDELLEEMRKLDDDIHDVNFENQVKKMLRDVMGSLNLTFNKCEGQDRYYLDFSELWSDKVLEMMDKLKEIKNKMEEHVKNKSSNLANLEKEFKAKKDEFYARWTKHTAFSKQIGKYGQFDPTYQDRQNAANWCQKAFITKNEQAMRQAIECCNKAINSMNKYESANKKAENANKKAENANKKVENANKKAEEVKKSSTELNKELNKLKTNVDGMIKSTEDKLQDCSERDYDRKVSLVTLLSNLEAAQRLLKEISGIAVNDPDFANHIKQMFVDIDDMLDIFVIETGPVTVEFNEEKVPDMIEKLENIKKMMKENAKK